jgi:hypothetical protein
LDHLLALQDQMSLVLVFLSQELLVLVRLVEQMELKLMAQAL